MSQTSTDRTGLYRRVAVAGGLLLLVFAPPAWSAAGNSAVAGTSVAAGGRSQPDCSRILEDRALGLRWRWEKRSGGRPGRWVPVADQADQSDQSDQAETAGCAELRGKAASVVASETKPRSAATAQPMVAAMKPVIQVGDPVVVIQSQGSVLARLPGVAMAAASAGSPLLVRLRVGNGGFGKAAGRIVHTRAVAHGLVQWDGAMEWSGSGW